MGAYSRLGANSRLGGYSNKYDSLLMLRRFFLAVSADFHQMTPIKTLKKKCGRLCCQFILKLVAITHTISATNQIAGLSFLSSTIASYCLIFDLQLLNKFLFLFSLEFEFITNSGPSYCTE